MGGNLLKTWHLPEKRLNSDEYREISIVLIEKLQKDNCFFNSVKIPPSIRHKDSHGDIDICCSIRTSNLLDKSKEFSLYIEKEFGYSPHINDQVYSFPYNGFQIDVALVDSGIFDSFVNYCSWNDTSNLMGRIFHKMGLHYGHTGLSYWIRQGLYDNNSQWSDNDHIYEKFQFELEMETICEIGGFDYERWKQGFDTENDVFDFVINSKYFDPSLFALENLNHINRIRNRKRGMYMRFVEKVATLEKKESAIFLDKEEYSLIFQHKFPRLRKAIDKCRFQYNISKKFKEKLNGRIIMELFPDISGPIIGKLMSKIKEYYTDIEIIAMTSDEIESLCRFVYMNYVTSDNKLFKYDS